MTAELKKWNIRIRIIEYDRRFDLFVTQRATARRMMYGRDELINFEDE
jgi:hypothetical protein